MNKFIISIISLALFGICSFSYAQNKQAFGFDDRGLYCAQDEDKDYAVFEMPDLSANQIKGSLYTKLTSMYKSPKDVITNISDSIIQLEGYASHVYYSETKNAMDFSFNIIIQIKDGKVRYDIPNITQIFMLDVPILGTARFNMEKPLSSLVDNESDRLHVANYFNNLVDELNNSIRATDDW